MFEEKTSFLDEKKASHLFIEIVQINLSKNPYVFRFKMLFEICG